MAKIQEDNGKQHYKSDSSPGSLAENSKGTISNEMRALIIEKYNEGGRPALISRETGDFGKIITSVINVFNRQGRRESKKRGPKKGGRLLDNEKRGHIRRKIEANLLCARPI